MNCGRAILVKKASAPDKDLLRLLARGSSSSPLTWYPPTLLAITDCLWFRGHLCSFDNCSTLLLASFSIKYGIELLWRGICCRCGVCGVCAF
jgi:hypothetical protein